MDQSVTLLGIGDVRHPGVDTPPGLRDEGRGIGEPIYSPCAQNQVSPGLGECLRERHTQPGRGAGHDDHSAVQSETIQNGHDGSRNICRAIAYL
jgi:hypothetical protein